MLFVPAVHCRQYGASEVGCGTGVGTTVLTRREEQWQELQCCHEMRHADKSVS